MLQENFENYQYYMYLAHQCLNKINYDGTIYRTTTFWKDIIQFQNDFKYLEVGVFQGANLLSMLLEYPNCVEAHGIDPWCDHNDYTEYLGKQNQNEQVFYRNFNKLSDTDKQKVCIHKDFSNNVIPKFDDEYFDLIYIDGNHEPWAVLEDGILSFRKLKVGGIMVFDDLNWINPNGDNTNVALEAFLKCYKNKIEIVKIRNCQMYIKKIKN